MDGLVRPRSARALAVYLVRVRRDRLVSDPIPSTTAIYRVMARIVAESTSPIAGPMSENRTVCGQSTITSDGARSPFPALGVTAIRRLAWARKSVVIGRIVA
jgi:hypothetical protein